MDLFAWWVEIPIECLRLGHFGFEIKTKNGFVAGVKFQLTEEGKKTVLLCIFGQGNTETSFFHVGLSAGKISKSWILHIGSLRPVNQLFNRMRGLSTVPNGFCKFVFVSKSKTHPSYVFDISVFFTHYKSENNLNKMADFLQNCLQDRCIHTPNNRCPFIYKINKKNVFIYAKISQKK